MDTVQTLLFILEVVVAVALIGFILIQHGKGADAGAAFGSGSSATVFGSQGAGNFLTRVTTVLAVIFLGNSLLLAYLATQQIRTAPASLLDQPAAIIEQAAPPPEAPATVEQETGPADSDLPSLPSE